MKPKINPDATIVPNDLDLDVYSATKSFPKDDVNALLYIRGEVGKGLILQAAGQSENIAHMLANNAINNKDFEAIFRRAVTIYFKKKGIVVAILNDHDHTP